MRIAENEKKFVDSVLTTTLAEALRLLDVEKDELFKIEVREGGFVFLENQFCSVAKLPPSFDLTKVFVDKVKQKFSIEDGEFLYFVFVCLPCEVLAEYEEVLRKNIEEMKRVTELVHQKRKERLKNNG